MLAAANTTLDLLVLELVLHGALLGVLLGIGGLSLPVRAGTEDHVLTDGGGVEGGARRVALLEAELGPRPALGDLWVDVLSDDGGLDPASDLHFLVVIVETVGDDRLGAVFVLGNLGCGQRCWIIVLIIIGPVGVAVRLKEGKKLVTDSRKFCVRKYSLPESRHGVWLCDAATAQFWDFFKGESVVDFIRGDFAVARSVAGEGESREWCLPLRGGLTRRRASSGLAPHPV